MVLCKLDVAGQNAGCRQMAALVGTVAGHARDLVVCVVLVV